MLDRLTLLNPRETTDRHGEQEPDAPPVTISWPMHTVFYT
jgi:hypothetical protein